MYKIRQGYCDGKDLGRDNRFGDQGRVIRDYTAIPQDGIGEQKPGEKPAKQKYRKAVGAGARPEFLAKEHAEDKGVADQENQWMDDRPEEPAHRSYISMLQIAQDEVLQQIPVRYEFFKDENHRPYGYTGQFSPFKGRSLPALPSNAICSRAAAAGNSCHTGDRIVVPRFLIC